LALAAGLLITAGPLFSQPAQAQQSWQVLVSIGEDSQLARFELDPKTGKLTPRETIAVPGSPGALVLSTKQPRLYVALRNKNSVADYSLGSEPGDLELLNTTPVVENPVYLALDRNERFLLTSYYGKHKLAIYPLNGSFQVGETATEVLDTEKNPHSLQIDRSNRFLYVPNTGADSVLQYAFDAATGKLQPLDPPKVMFPTKTGPRHFYFHPQLPFVYFVNEHGSSVTACRQDSAQGTLSVLQTITTLPPDFTGKNFCAHIEITPDGKYLYASNRGHNSLAMYRIDAKSGELTSLGQQATEAIPRAFNLDPRGQYLIAAGQASHKLEVFRVDSETGTLRSLEIVPVGRGPAWVSIFAWPRSR